MSCLTRHSLPLWGLRLLGLVWMLSGSELVAFGSLERESDSTCEIQCAAAASAELATGDGATVVSAPRGMPLVAIDPPAIPRQIPVPGVDLVEAERRCRACTDMVVLLI